MRPGFSALALTLLLAQNAAAQDLNAEIDRRIPQVMPKVVQWRRDIHQHPELSNQETRTARLVADHLKSLGLEVRENVAKTGVVGLLRGGRPGPVIALRADMDALPVTEMVDLPFKSTARGVYNGVEVGIMHACGHDTHVAMLMGVAEILAGMKQQIPGTIKFIFQPAEEGAPPGETGGAGDMIKESVLENPKVSAIFGLHAMNAEAGSVGVRTGGILASSDNLRIVVRGRQTHGAMPWQGVDPIVVSAQIINALQTIVSRSVDLTGTPAVVTIGRIEGGIRFNIIPDSVIMVGTVRALDPVVQRDVHARIKKIAETTAQASGATASVEIMLNNPVTLNDAALTEQMIPSLRRAANNRFYTPRTSMGAEDFAKYQELVPGMFFILGITPKGTDPAKAPANHSPYFFVDESALPVGVRAMAFVAVDYLRNPRGNKSDR
jgi:amidohydrolase